MNNSKCISIKGASQISGIKPEKFNKLGYKYIIKRKDLDELCDKLDEIKYKYFCDMYKELNTFDYKSKN